MAEATRWMAIAIVHTEKTYSQFWFYKNMRSAWYLAKEVKFQPFEDNIYTLQFFCLGDWERVMDFGPWNFCGDVVVIAPYDGIAKPSTINLDTLELWIQIHDLLDLFVHLLKPLAAKVGEVVCVEPTSHGFTGNFYRVKVNINVRNPLKNVGSIIKDNKRQMYKVKYERLPDWFAVCRHLGHLFMEHGDGLHPL